MNQQQIEDAVTRRMTSLTRICQLDDPSVFVISSGCALALLGLRETFDDIDAAVDAETFEHLVGLGFEVDVRHSSGKPVIHLASVNADIHLDLIQAALPTQLMLGRFRILTPAELLAQKEELYKRLGRAKDQTDIAALNKYIAQQETENAV